MTHDELLTMIEDKFNNHSGMHDAQIVNALYRIVELHKPSGIFCRGCGFIEEYNEPAQLLPCPTIQAIEKELA
jgi:hypothetical protein